MLLVVHSMTASFSGSSVLTLTCETELLSVASDPKPAYLGDVIEVMDFLFGLLDAGTCLIRSRAAWEGAVGRSGKGVIMR